MVEPDEDPFHEYFCTVGSGLENFLADELRLRSTNTVRIITNGKVYFSSNLSPKELLSIKTAERLFILVRKEKQFLLNRTKRDAISRYRAMVEGDSAHHWERCLNKWKFFYEFLTKSMCEDILKFRVSCKCSGKLKNIFPSYFLGKILAGSLLNVHSEWIPELRSPQLEVLVHADMNSLTIGLACCLFNQPLSKRPYLSDDKGHTILRPTICSAMLALAFKSDECAKTNNLNEAMVILDPLCGTGMILAEAASYLDISESFLLLGSDADGNQINEAVKNIKRVEDMRKVNLNYSCHSKKIRLSTNLFLADARALPLKNDSVHCIVSDIPFGLKHTCKPWPRHLRYVLTKFMNLEDTVYHAPSECSSDNVGEVKLHCHVNNSDDEREEKKPRLQKKVGALPAAIGTVRNNKVHYVGARHCKRGVKRKDPCVGNVSKSIMVEHESGIDDARNMLPQIIVEMDRVMVQGGRVVLLISEALKPSLLEAVHFLTLPSKSLELHSGCRMVTSTSCSEVCTVAVESTASESLNGNLGCSCELPQGKDVNNQNSVGKGWSCIKEHPVRLGILDAIICVFDT